MIYLYALVAAPCALPDVAGIDGTPTACLDCDAIAAVVGELEASRVEQSAETILAHARVVDAVSGVNDATLPARFGTAFQAPDSLRAAVAERADELRAALGLVRDCVELGLRVLAPRNEEAAPMKSSGSAYLRGRLDAVRRSERAAAEVHDPLAQLARATTVSVRPTPDLLLSAGYLVPRESVDEFRTKLVELRELRPELTFACTGPWAPYSFATAEIAPA